jgi:ATP-dependent DNA helicase RecG
MKATLFVSSAQKELKAERRAIKGHVEQDPLLRRFFEVFLFEDLPAADRRADDVYLAEVDRCGLYVGLFGNEHSAPTEREFDRATSKGKIRLVYVKGTDDKARQPEMNALIERAAGQLCRRRFETTEELVRLVNESLVDHLQERGVIEDRPSEERLPSDATLDDISAEEVDKFVRRARAERRMRLPQGTSAADVLTHLGVLRDGRPATAAILLFGRDPWKILPAAEVRCMHFHGTTVQRPAPSYQVFKGTVFNQVDRAVDFVLSVLNRRVGTRDQSPRAPVSYDVPPDVVHEAIVNAVAHRDYASRASVQVSVFADRVEVRNPGGLPVELTPEKLREPHQSYPRNARICEALFRTRYIERYGTGTLMMIERCGDAGLPEPVFGQEPGGFVLTVWRDWLTKEALARAGLNDRQRQALAHLKVVGRLDNAEYQRVTKSAKKTASRDLDGLVGKGLLQRVGKTGRGTYYVGAGKGGAKGTKGSSLSRETKGDIKGTKGTSPKKEKQAVNRPNRPSASSEKGDKNRTNRTSRGTRVAGSRKALATGSKRKVKKGESSE